MGIEIEERQDNGEWITVAIVDDAQSARPQSRTRRQPGPTDARRVAGDARVGAYARGFESSRVGCHVNVSC